MWTTLVVIVTTVALFGGGRHGQEPKPTASSGPTYQEFMKLSRQQRTERFSALSPENRALIIRTHAEQWLERNRGRLSTGQVALVQKAIDFVTPALYRTPNDPELIEKSKALELELQCRMRRSDLLEAFGPGRSPVPASWLDDMWAWFESCIVG
jgi:hypothetical protein